MDSRMPRSDLLTSSTMTRFPDLPFHHPVAALADDLPSSSRLEWSSPGLLERLREWVLPAGRERCESHSDP